MSKAFKCEWCKKYINKEVSYQLTITDLYQDTRDGDPDETYDICEKCEKMLKNKLKCKEGE